MTTMMMIVMMNIFTIIMSLIIFVRKIEEGEPWHHWNAVNVVKRFPEFLKLIARYGYSAPAEILNPRATLLRARADSYYRRNNETSV